MAVQGSDEWHLERVGKITMSRAADVMAFDNKGRPLKARTDYIFELACERITGKPKQQVKAKSLEHGNVTEPKARKAYEIKTGNIVDLVGFVIHPEHDFIGASADWLMDENEGGEIKCPIDPTVHLQTLLDGIPSEHIPQVQGNLFVSGRKVWNFISYSEAFPNELQLFIAKVERDDAYIKMLERNCLTLHWQVQELVQKIKSKYEVQI
jgi:putative phage-type endonuclease